METIPMVNVKRNADNLRESLDSSRPTYNFRVTEKATEHMTDCIKNPTIGLIVQKEVLDGKKKCNPIRYYLKKTAIKYFEPTISRMKDYFELRIQTLYPKTAAIRKFIVDTGRISLERVKAVRKMNLFEKIRYIIR